MTEKDRNDLRAGVEAGIDFVALSFVRQADDVETLKSFLKELGSEARIIAKIEDQAGVRNMKEIIRAADGVMVARGDLGIEIDYPKLPLVQTQLIAACQADGKPVIVATHMLESMISSPIPTRAEVSDVSHAIREQADAIMLSGETTTGSYPLESVEVFKNIIESRDGSLWLATEGPGLVVIKKKGPNITYTTEDGLAGNSIGDLFEDSKDRIWRLCC